MSWREEQERTVRDQERSERRFATFLVIAIAAVILSAMVAYNAWAFDDWTCAFSRCVKIENVKGAR